MRLLRKRRTVAARHIAAAGSHEELRGIPGAITQYSLGGVAAHDCCCPGCGEQTYHLNPDRYPMSGQIEPTNSLTCAEPITFVPCCGTTWRLANGIWHQR